MHTIRQSTSLAFSPPVVWIGLLFSSLLLAGNPPAGFAHTTDVSQAKHVILIVLEGIGNDALQSHQDSLLAKLAKEGATSWSAQSVSPPLTVPAMASLLTGLPIEKHRVTPAWQRYDFARSFLRSPTIFDYMDLAAGKDSAVFFMDERLYQLSRPEIYVDSQICGIAKPNCTPQTVAAYIEDYLQKVTNEGGYGFRLFAIPDLLLVHLPTAAQAGMKFGWESPAYHQAVQAVNEAIGKIMQVYQAHGILHKTMILVTGLNSPPAVQAADTHHAHSPASTKLPLSSTIPWIAWGANVKRGYQITQPVSLLDTGATILYALGLETHTEWDSKPITEIFQTVPKKQTTENERFLLQ